MGKSKIIFDPIGAAKEVAKIPEASCDESQLPSPIDQMCSKEGTIAPGVLNEGVLKVIPGPVEKGCEYFLWKREEAMQEGPRASGKMSQKAFDDFTGLLMNEYEYCQLFNQKYYPEMSEGGKKWHDGRRCDFQKRMEGYFQKAGDKWIPSHSAELTHKAFEEMHGQANSIRLKDLPFSDYDIFARVGPFGEAFGKWGERKGWGRTFYNLPGAYTGPLVKDTKELMQNATFKDWMDLFGKAAETMARD